MFYSSTTIPSPCFKDGGDVQLISTCSSPHHTSSSPRHKPLPPLADYLSGFQKEHSTEPEFIQAHREVAESLIKVFDEDPIYFEVFKILSEPERLIQFRILWRDDSGKIQMNRGFRVQYNSALGPYKGGLRFHPSVNISILKFLGFEQIMKNSLTGLQLGGAKGGSDFDPKGKSDMEVRSFCKSFMTELAKYIGPTTDVPAGDIGVGGREIGFMYGQYRKIQNCFTGVLTGKSIGWGGSLIRTEATGYGAVYYAQIMYKTFFGKNLKGLRCLVSGSGNAAQYTCEKLIELEAIVLTVSDSSGSLFFPNGMTQDDLKVIMEHKNVQRARLAQVCLPSSQYFEEQQPWFMEGDCELAFPAATQNELDADAMECLLEKPSFRCVVEVANMPTTPAAIEMLKKKNGILCPGKAANAGGVAVSGLEMAQNAAMLNWDASDVDQRLKSIMETIFQECVEYAKKYGNSERDLITGANVRGFMKVADAMLQQGLF